jgi:hypothetical protein
MDYAATFFSDQKSVKKMQRNTEISIAWKNGGNASAEMICAQ